MTNATQTVEVAKPVVKAAAVKPAKAKAAPASKAASVSVEKAPVKAAPKRKPAATKGAPKAAIGLSFCLIDRPVAGGNLYAFTQAVLNLTGMANGKGASKALLTTVMGATAVRYHITKTTFAVNDKGLIVLTPAGKHSFAERVAKGQVDQSTVEGYEELFRTGKANPNLAMAKNQVMIRSVA